MSPDTPPSRIFRSPIGMERRFQANRMMSENPQKIRKLRRLRRPHRSHQANQITTEDNLRTVSPRAATGRISSGVEARRPWREMCPRWPPPHPERDGAVPGAAGEGNGTVRIPTTLDPGAGPRGRRGVKPSPLPGMRGNGTPRFSGWTA